ncbi:hypothetical protein [Streptomyces cyaneofuscatus]|uniref:hypothetical protein n=1 Tax=Streptomyces cyaneofuscatus TaxID=66883 RepID=UPI0037B4E17A
MRRAQAGRRPPLGRHPVRRGAPAAAADPRLGAAPLPVRPRGPRPAPVRLAERAAGLGGPGRPLAGLVAALLPPPGEATDDIAVIAFRADDVPRPP